MRRTILLATAACLAAVVHAGEPATLENRPAGSGGRSKTCLVLSGGGARGTAHVGVLREIEALQIPVDCIVGTSMGAIVGGLYASGLSPERIERAFLDADWRELFTDRPPRKNVPFRRKQDDDRSLFGFELGVGRGGLKLPSGLVAGQKLDFLLKRLTLHTAGARTFDDLAIPFRAIATDLSSGRMVVLDRGNLAGALRASMAVPGVFTPVVRDGMTLVDGGLVRNLPVDVARSLGAGIVIAVDVTMPPELAPDDASVVRVASQTIDLLTEQNVQEQRDLLGADDVLIRPDLDAVKAIDFDSGAAAIDLGVDAARAARDRLERLSRPGEFETWRQRHRESGGSTGEIVVLDEVAVTGLERVDPRRVVARVRTLPGRPLELDTLSGDLERVYEMGDFESVAFTLQREDDDRNVLSIRAREKSWGPSYLRFGLALEADFEGRGEFVALANYTATNLNRFGAEWNSFISVGEINGIETELYQPLDYSGLWFVAPHARVQRAREDLIDPTGVSRFRIDGSEVGFDLGAQFRNYGEIRVGVRRGRIKADLESGPFPEPELRIDTGGWIGQLVIDQFDNANFPRRGSFGSIELYLSRRSLGADEDYDRMEVAYGEARSFHRNTLVGFLRYGSGLGSEIPFYDGFDLGGFLNLSGVEPGQLVGPVLGFAQLVYYREIARLPGGIGEGFYVGLSAEAGNIWPSTSEADLGDLRPAGAVFAGLDTLFGPLYLGYGRADGGEDSFYLFLGRPF